MVTTAAQARRFDLDVPREALADVARLAGQQLIFSPDPAKGRLSPAITGALRRRRRCASRPTRVTSKPPPRGASVILTYCVDINRFG